MSATEDARRQAELAREAKQRGLPEYVVEAARSVPTDVVRSIVDDFRRGPSQPSSLGTTPEKKPTEPKQKTGWQEATPLQQPPGIDLIDRMVAVQDKINAAQKIQELASIIAMSQRAEKMK
jgi:hypothetical protein